MGYFEEISSILETKRTTRKWSALFKSKVKLGTTQPECTRKCATQAELTSCALMQEGDSTIEKLFRRTLDLTNFFRDFFCFNNFFIKSAFQPFWVDGYNNPKLFATHLIMVKKKLRHTNQTYISKICSMRWPSLLI